MIVAHMAFGLLTFLGDRYLLQNMDWLEEELGGFEDDYLIFDCPGMSTVFSKPWGSH